jgi:hypothetical protein
MGAALGIFLTHELQTHFTSPIENQEIVVCLLKEPIVIERLWCLCGFHKGSVHKLGWDGDTHQQITIPHLLMFGRRSGRFIRHEGILWACMQSEACLLQRKLEQRCRAACAPDGLSKVIYCIITMSGKPYPTLSWM